MKSGNILEIDTVRLSFGHTIFLNDDICEDSRYYFILDKSYFLGMMDEVEI